jgi:arylsulfatase A-like enzyme
VPIPPNILWILTTQWRAQACGYAGDPDARTPFLDALAARSVNYAQAVTPHPFGPFARAAVLTGLPSPENGVRDYFDPLPAEARTVAHEMAERSYSTAFFGKWHLFKRDPSSELTGEAHARIVVPPQFRGGFGYWEGFESGFLLNNPWLHGTRIPTPERFEGYQSDVVCGRALQHLRALDGPWFSVVSLEAPHPPYNAPASGIAPHDPAGLGLRGNVPPEAASRARRELAGYYAHIEATDRAIGRLVEGLPASTRIVVTSVHGDMHGSHGLFRKGWPHEESIRVPLLVSGPDGPRRDESPYSIIRLSEMSRGWADGSDAPPKVHAGCLISMPSVVALPDQCDRKWSGMRTPGRKMISNGDGTPWLLYDLARDPLETRNLWKPEHEGDLRAMMSRVR